MFASKQFYTFHRLIDIASFVVASNTMPLLITAIKYKIFEIALFLLRVAQNCIHAEQSADFFQHKTLKPSSEIVFGNHENVFTYLYSGQRVARWLAN